MERRYAAVCWVRGVRRAALWGGGGGQPCTSQPPLGPSAPCKPRIPKFPIPIPAPSAPCKPRIPKFPIPLPAPSAPCKPRIPKFLIPLPAPSALCKPRIPSVPNSTFRRPRPCSLRSCKLAIPSTLANSQIPKSNPGPKAPKAKRFRIPRVQRLKLHFPPCNHAQPDGYATAERQLRDRCPSAGERAADRTTLAL